jgi:hypothetical protein
MGDPVYRNRRDQLEFEDFYIPFRGGLRSDNRWVRLAKLIPWDRVEERYEESFTPGKGPHAKPVRMALGALIIKAKLDLTDEETVEQIRENRYLQYFIGLEGYTDEAPFDSSMMVHFRRRLGAEVVNEFNEKIVLERVGFHEERDATDRDDTDDDDDDGDEGTSGGSGNHGQLLIDATWIPADIRYPTDLSLLSEAREKTEEMIDVLHKPFRGKRPKPRTYRRVARRRYLEVIKQKRPRGKRIRSEKRYQLGCISRNLKSIDELMSLRGHGTLTARQKSLLPIIRELYKQQLKMYEKRTNSHPDRIVSLSQPHVRPIVRGKAGSRTEFGAKLTISLVDGYSVIERVSWDAYNESCDLKDQVERYRERFGCYPESVHVDKLYRNRDNRRYCRERGIRISGPQLGRPPKDAKVRAAIRKQVRDDLVKRNEVEGAFGVSKRRYTLDRLKCRLKETSESMIALVHLVMNLERWLRATSLSLRIRRLSDLLNPRGWFEEEMTNALQRCFSVS